MLQLALYYINLLKSAVLCVTPWFVSSQRRLIAIQATAIVLNILESIGFFDIAYVKKLFIFYHAINIHDETARPRPDMSNFYVL